MGLPALAFVVAGLIARLRGRDERPASAFSTSGLADRVTKRLIGTPAASPTTSGFGAAASASTTDAKLDELERLQRLRDAGALSEAEFAEQKARILGN
ncbi:MAG: SHOCT domain-containing protein [Solirubrobacterales bacterium]|nr:SHOCT domain-containing protein [Solirubrobacterales bacterium]